MVPPEPAVAPTASPNPATPPKMKPIAEPNAPVVEKQKPPVKPAVKKPIAATPVPPPKPVVTAPRTMCETGRWKKNRKRKDVFHQSFPMCPHQNRHLRLPPIKVVSPRDPSQSAITGPKTMPALPATSVDQQFENNKASEDGETMLERRQKEVQDKSETLTPIVPAPNPNVTPAEFEKGKQGALKKIIPFTPGQMALPPPMQTRLPLVS